MTNPHGQPTPHARYQPTAERVAVAWLGAVDGLAPDYVGAELPSDPSTWLESGFVQVQAIPGGAPDVDTPQWRRAVVQVDTWAAGGASSITPRWNLAAHLAEHIRDAIEAQAYGQVIDLGPHYYPARVQAVYFVTEPRRVLDDPSGYARFTTDLAVDWVRNP